MSDGSVRKMTKRLNVKKPFKDTWDVKDLFEDLKKKKKKEKLLMLKKPFKGAM